MVPSEAVQQGQDGLFVCVVKSDHTVAFRPVTIGLTSGDDSVVNKGIQAGEQVVTSGQLRLIPGPKMPSL